MNGKIAEITMNLHCSIDQRKRFNNLKSGRLPQWKLLKEMIDAWESADLAVAIAPPVKAASNACAIRVLERDIKRLRDYFPHLRPHQALEILMDYRQGKLQQIAS